MAQSPVKSLLFVSKLRAGSGIALSPANGTGIVTISADAPLNDVNITGGTIAGVTINSSVIGGTTPAAVTASALHVDSGTKVATASGGAATLNKAAGVITSETLTTAAGASYVLTLTDSAIAATDQLMASVALGTATTGTPCVTSVKPGTGSAVITIQNVHASAALNGTILISFVNFKN